MTETDEKTFLYHLNMRHMSGRVVKFRELEQDEVDAICANAARVAGPDADMSALLKVQKKMLHSAFVVGYTAPGQEPARKVLESAVEEQRDEAGNVTVKAKAAVTVIDDGGKPDVEKLQGVAFTTPGASLLERDWSKVFSTKETACLTQLYRDWHEINMAELEMILGKGIPTPTGV